MIEQHAAAAAFGGGAQEGEVAESGGRPASAPAAASSAPMRSAPRVGRNDPCPCGSGQKYKKCCGA
jgi:preprotein translocase subunit SecA